MSKCPTCGKEWPKCNVLFKDDGSLIIWFFKNKDYVYINDKGECLVIEPKVVKWIMKALKNQGAWFDNGAKRKD